VYRVKAITHRRRPILTMSNMGMPLDDSDVANSVGFAARLTVELRRKGIPLRDVVCVTPECSLHLAVVSVRRAYAGIARQVANIIWADKAGNFTPYVVVCDEDVDPADLAQVAHAITTRCHPVRGIHVDPDTPGNPLLPFASLAERSLVKAPKCLIDCTWPVDWPPEAIPAKVSFATSYPPELQQRVVQQWGSYGLR